jgi:shikimate kinase
MATGKSSVGRILSERSGWPLVDTDDEIVRRAGRSVQGIFDENGEAVFRDLERQVIAELCAGRRRIIAAGGGAFIDAGNRSLMLASGLVFCLRASPRTIHSRLSGGGGDSRPLLAWGDAGDRSEDFRVQHIDGLLAQRTGSYAQAHHNVDTDALTPCRVAERILEMWGPQGFSGG